MTAPATTSVALAVVPRLSPLPAGGPSIQLGYVRGVLRGGAADSVVAQAPFQGDSAILTFNVAVAGQSEVFILTLTAYDRAVQVVFTGVDTIRVTPGAGSLIVPTSPMRYAAQDTLVAALKVVPKQVQLNAGQSASLDVAGTSQAGQPIAPILVGWTSRNPAVVTVNPSGIAQAGLFEGQTWLVARTATNAADSASVTVRAPVSSISIAPASTNIARSDSVQLIASLVDAGNHPITDRSPTWSASDPSKATVTPGGWVKGVALGVVTVTAQAEGHSGTAQVAVVRPVASVNITPAPLTLTSLTGVQALQATPVTPAGVPQSAVSGLPVSWSTSNPAVASVDSKGTVTANANGVATITATIDSVSGTLPVVVAQVAATLKVAPKPGRVAALQTTVAFHGGAQDARGQPVSDALLKWTSLDPGIASIDPTGVATAIAPGTARIVASSGAIADTGTLIVSQIPVFMGAAAVPDRLTVGGTARVFPALVDANSQPVQGATYTYASLNPNVVGVNSSGVATMLTTGAGQIKVMSGGWSALAPITGSSNEPAGLTVLADNAFTHPLPVGHSLSITGEEPWSINNPDGLATTLPGGGLQYLYRGGVPMNGGSPATTFFDVEPVTTMYWRAVWQASSPWTPSENGHTKILALGGILLVLDGDGTTPYQILVETSMPTDQANYVGVSPVALGVPHVIEWLIDVPAGRTTFWMDGVLQGTFRINFPAGFNMSEPQIYGGFGSNAPAQDQTFLYSHIYVSGKP